MQGCEEAMPGLVLGVSVRRAVAAHHGEAVQREARGLPEMGVLFKGGTEGGPRGEGGQALQGLYVRENH